MACLVISPAIDAARLTAVREVVQDRLEIVNAATPEQALAAMPRATAFFGKITPPLLQQAGQLQWVQSATASLEHYVFPELVEHPCVLTNMRGLFSDVIADHVLSYVLCFARNLHLYLRQQQRSHWEPIGGESERSDFVSGVGTVSQIDRSHIHLSDSSLGVVGVGHIGREILRRASAFGLRLTGVDPVCRTIPGVLDEVWPLERLPDLLRDSQFVVIAAPHTPATAGLFDRALLRQMRRDAYLINIGRGAIVKLADLTAALDAGEIAGAALDVFETEPLPAEHPLWQMQNVILTPHIAAASPRIAERHLATLLENLQRFLAGEPLLTPVDKRNWF